MDIVYETPEDEPVEWTLGSNIHGEYLTSSAARRRGALGILEQWLRTMNPDRAGLWILRGWEVIRWDEKERTWFKVG